MRTFTKLFGISLLSGTVLAGFLLIVNLLTYNQAYMLLFNVDYIPILKRIQPRWLVEITYHYVFCIMSIVCLYGVLCLINKAHKLVYYISVYTVGSAILFSLTVFSTSPPAVTDGLAWMYWTIAHALYGFTVGYLIKRLL